ncbi:MAG TPA: tRNA (N6-threonylcarbamoyladenosine(37)-N6)-methyltransferase TrmO [Bacteroidales bacterium]|nr:tRNA (N6-threonylcarbamoyladenosine(37)-N6)-methyltransferase TrmO [Bacteroidales bacterium]
MRYHSNRILLITLTGLLAVPLMGQGKTDQQIVYKPVGVFHSGYSERTGAPRQGILKPDGKGTIEIFNEYQGALKSLELFEYIIVIYHFDKAYNWNLIARPPASDPDLTFGLFATRSPNRPNPIGIATVRLEKTENGKLHVSGIDAFDGTPVLDIKPYLPSIDCVKSSVNEQAEKKLGL